MWKALDKSEMYEASAEPINKDDKDGHNSENKKAELIAVCRQLCREKKNDNTLIIKKSTMPPGVERVLKVRHVVPFRNVVFFFLASQMQATMLLPRLRRNEDAVVKNFTPPIALDVTYGCSNSVSIKLT
ncbi:hypothetical protein TRIUR3_03156 [Triticum urartu]|uniref:Uncharacterized protein n=1 Tax=Triticum urartu TaxID=4572 RepID=M7YM25_TRIUA|nr:hypothetical protein TRIUR3_03156 [Triticum urartu]